MDDTNSNGLLEIIEPLDSLNPPSDEESAAEIVDRSDKQKDRHKHCQDEATPEKQTFQVQLKPNTESKQIKLRKYNPIDLKRRLMLKQKSVVQMEQYTKSQERFGTHLKRKFKQLEQKRGEEKHPFKDRTQSQLQTRTRDNLFADSDNFRAKIVQR